MEEKGNGAAGGRSVGSLPAFFVLTFLVSVLLWPVGVFVHRLLQKGTTPYVVVDLAWHVALACMPMAAALILARREAGREGVGKLLGRPFDRGRITRKIWYLPVLLLFPLLMIIEYGLLSLSGASLPGLLRPSILLVPVLFAVFFAAGIGEELGWTGYALDPLQARYGALGAAVVLGAASAAFHLVPLIIDGHPPAWIAWHLAHMVPYRIVLVWIYNVTGRSMFAVVAFHATSNIGETVWPFFLGRGYDPFVTTVLVTATALALLFLWGPRDLARFRFGRSRR